MFPVLFKIGLFPVYSFGVMQGVGALLTTIILYKEVKRNFDEFRIVAYCDKTVTVIQKESCY